MNKLNISGLNKYYGKFHALKDINIEISPGIFGLLGPNGAGKTTLIRVLATLFKKDSGNITYSGINWEKADEVRQIIGYLPQKFFMYKSLSVKEVLRHVAVLKGIKEDREKKVTEIIEKVNLQEHMNKKMGQLSGGMVRRVGIAQAILGDPKIIIVDEPTAGLDPEERLRFRNLINSLDKNSIILISTHIVDDVETICNEVAILNNGEVCTKGNINSLINELQGKVWEIDIPFNEVDKYSTEWEVVSKTRSEKGYLLRIVSKDHVPSAKSVQPNLEDIYLCEMRGI
jgi:ABC-2 type transport system ATP-binding protein